MTLAQTRRISRHRRSPEEIAEDVYDAMPTTLYNRDERTSGVVRAGPRYFRGTSPSPARANAPTLSAIPTRSTKPSRLATFSIPSPRPAPASSPVVPEAARISEMLRELPIVPALDGSRPLTCAQANVFLTPPDPMAAPPMWSSALHGPRKSANAQDRPRRRRSLLPYITAAIAIAIGVGLWQDEAARAEVASDVARTADQVTAFVMEAAIR